MKIIFNAIIVSLLFSCAAPLSNSKASGFQPDYSNSRRSNANELKSSLFGNDDKELSQSDIDRILDGILVKRENLRIAVFRIKNKNSVLNKFYGYNTEERLDTESKIDKTVLTEIVKSKYVKWAKPLPSLLEPEDLSIDKFRKAAVRLQADILVIFSVASNTFYDFNLFDKNKVKAYSSCELLAFDVRTGIIPYSKTITRKSEVTQRSDEDSNGVKKRAEEAALFGALKELAVDFRISFLQN